MLSSWQVWKIGYRLKNKTATDKLSRFRVYLMSGRWWRYVGLLEICGDYWSNDQVELIVFCFYGDNYDCLKNTF